jgi:hypothetical protein
MRLGSSFGSLSKNEQEKRWGAKCCSQNAHGQLAVWKDFPRKQIAEHEEDATREPGKR